MKEARPWRPSPVGKRPFDQAWQRGAVAPEHVVSDGDRAIASGLEMVYGREVPHQLCHFHLLREYRRNLGWDGWVEARRLLASASVAEAQRWARRVVALSGGQAEYWCRKALREGLRHLQTAQGRFKTTWRLEVRTESTGVGSGRERYDRPTTY